MSNTDCGKEWIPVYSKWRHGGWYVSNVRYLGGACGCVSNNYPDRKWRIVCDPRRTNLGEEGDITFTSRHAAAVAENEMAKQEVAEELISWTTNLSGDRRTKIVGDHEIAIITNAEHGYQVSVSTRGEIVKRRTTGCFEQAVHWGREEALALDTSVVNEESA